MYKPPYARHMSEIPSNPIFSLLPYLHQPGFISLAPGAPAPESFPKEDLIRITQKALCGDFGAIMQYGSTEGYPPLRRSLVDFVARAGVKCTPEEVFVTTGGQQAIDLLCKLLVEPGDHVLVERPTYSATLQILRSYRAKTVGVLSDDEGVDPDDLEQKVKALRPKFVYLIPTHQNPSGRTMSLTRRRAAAEICGRHGVMLVEDDPYRDLSYYEAPPPTIKSFDSAGVVVYLTSTSKVLCPGLRVGAVVAPADLHAHLTVAKQAADMHSSNIPQAIVDGYLREGLLDAHIERLKELYRPRLEAMLAAVEEHFPEGTVITRPRGGLFVWCTLPERYDCGELLDTAAAQGVAYIPGAPFFPDGGGKNTMRLNFSTPMVEMIGKGVGHIGRILKEQG